MDELLNEFLTETNEALASVDAGIVKLEQNPNNPDLLSEIFRLVHTIKGTCGFLGLPRLESVAYVAEDVLGKYRDGKLTVTAESVTLILEALDCIRNILGVLERDEKEPDGDDVDLIARLRAVADGAGSSNAASMSDADAELAAGNVDFSGVAEAVSEEAEVATEAEAPAEAVAAAPAVTAAEAAPSAGASDAPVESKIANQNIRVGVDLLEHLMTMVSELVLTRNQLLQMVRGQTDNEFAAPLSRLSLVTTELQEGVMKTRMQPIGNAWAKLPRIIRDLSIELNKKIELKMLGADTELDRQVLELIKDPLTHMVRNSADHSLETPEDRRAAGKPEMGTVTLNAFHESGHIIIQISDDGRGINIDKVRKKSLENGLISEDDAETMSDQQISQLIFKPSLSTAAAVTNVSGRGVGMDVVRTNVEKIGGTIELKPVEDKGTVFTIKIPLTLAIVSALIVEASSERFAIPQISVVELVRASAHTEHNVELLNDAPVLRLRDRLLPLVSLSQALDIESEAKEFDTEAETFIVVSQVGTYNFGIMVDRVFDTEEIVVKPVAPMMRDIGVFSGNTILGDGSIVMILDPNGLASAGTQVTVTSEEEVEATATRNGQSDETLAMLVFKAGTGAPRAAPLALVARLEEIHRNTIEFSDGCPVVQYRGQLMPLVLTDTLQTLEGEGKTPIIVFSEGGRSMGLMVDEIIDIVDDALNVELGATQSGIAGSAVIAGKATDVVDACYYLTQAFSDWFKNHDSLGDGSGGN